MWSNFSIRQIKGCTTRTAEGFHLSRNEFDQCRRYPDEWRLVQVEFSPDALTAESLTASHVSAIRELRSGELLAIPPAESAEFYWESSARIAPPERAWIASAFTVPAGLSLPSIHNLGRQAFELRADLTVGRR